jgi:hypothetical protein
MKPLTYKLVFKTHWACATSSLWFYVSLRTSTAAGILAAVLPLIRSWALIDAATDPVVRQWLARPNPSGLSEVAQKLSVLNTLPN